MKLVRQLAIALFFNTCCYSTTVAPKPSFEEMLGKAKLIGIVKVVAVPELPPEGFSESAPPFVTVSVIASFRGLTNNTELKAQWDSGIRLDKITSYNSFMPIAKPSEIKIEPPIKGDDYFVFLEEFQKSGYRDIYGWNRRKVVQALPPNSKQELWPWSWVVINPSPFACIPRAKSSYNRRKYRYEFQPDSDCRLREAIWTFQVEEKGVYWILTGETAVACQYASKKPNPDWPVKHVVIKGETLSSIAEQHYGSSSKWRNILEANRLVIEDIRFLKPGVILTIPPEP